MRAKSLAFSLLVVLFVFSSGCFEVKDGKITLDLDSLSQIKGDANKMVSKSPIVKKDPLEDCKEKIIMENLIPKSMILTKYDRYSWEYQFYCREDMDYCNPEYNNYWGDGSPISPSAYKLLFYKGTLQGENVNYYYHRKHPSGFSWFQYTKKIIDDEGNIKGDRWFSIEMVLKQNSTLTITTPSEELIFGEFQVIDFSVVECNWIEYL